MAGYYREKLAAERLRRCYEIASPRVQQYLQAEIAYALKEISSASRVLELGCGYGRILAPVAKAAGHVIGIDNSIESLRYAGGFLKNPRNVGLVCADAMSLPFDAESFDVVACLQNGISAFRVDLSQLMREGLRVTRRGGTAMFSSYAAGFWRERLEWFRMQAAEGLVGRIDETRTGNGTIVCEDGFTASTVTPGEFVALAAGLNADVTIEEVDGSSLFCVLRRR